MDDDRIIGLYIARDEAAIDQTALKYGARLLEIASGITEDRQTAEACENDTYLEAWNTIPPHEPRSYLSAFLTRIVRSLSINRCVEKNRLKRKTTLCVLSDELEECLASGDSVAEQLEGKVLAETINRFLREQPTEKRIIFLHRYYFCEDIRSIASRFDTTGGKIKLVLFRMRKDLHEYLKKEGYQV